MDIDQHVNQIVQNLVAEITTKVQQQAAAAVDAKISEVLAAIDYTPIIADIINQRLTAQLSRIPIDSKSIEAELSNRVNTLATDLAATVQTRSMAVATESIQNQINKINFSDMCQSTLIAAIQADQLVFPPETIPASAINTAGLTLSGNNIFGGIINNFGSTGIDDKATTCQLSIFDEVTVVENNLITKDLTVKGSTTIEGDLIVTGNVPRDSALYVSLVNSVSDNVKTNLNEIIFDGYADLVFNRIKENGLDLSKITLNGTDIVNGGNLSNNITFSNLQRLGTLHELRVSGEALLSQTLYTTNKRIGINTIEPSQALSIWDQEVEIGFGKQTDGVAVIETPRNHSLVLSSNGKNNIILNTDGSITTHQVTIGAVTLSSSSSPPNTDAPTGSIVFNANPSIGGPLGWVSLGGARWANFGFID